MKRWLFKLSLVAMTFLLLPVQAVQACCEHHRSELRMVPLSLVRTEDYPYYQMVANTTKNYGCWCEKEL